MTAEAMKGVLTMSIRQTAGRDALGTIAPTFPRLNDAVLFGQVRLRPD